MINFTQDGFDTKILGRNVFKLFLEKDIENEKELPDLSGNGEIESIFCFTVFSHRNIHLLNKLGFALISIRNTYKLSSDPRNLRTSACAAGGCDVIRCSKSPIQLNRQDIRDMADIIGSTSRYFKDKQIPREKALNIYINWINNSIYNRYANESFLIMKGARLAGLIALKVKDNNGYIDLIGVHNDFQGLGLGKLLLQRGLQYFVDGGVGGIFVVSEGENIQASAFYQKTGFVINKVELVYHRHKGR